MVAPTVVNYPATDIERMQIKSDIAVSASMYQWVLRLAKEWNVSPYTIAILGGKPYPMQGALFKMLQDKCEAEGLKVIGVKTSPLHRATQQEFRSGFECFFKMMDVKHYMEMLKAVKEKIDVSVLQQMKEMWVHEYRDEGWASPSSVKMTTLHNLDFIGHMAQTRAVDRTLRLIVRCPFTAASELPDGTPDDTVLKAFPDGSAETPIPSSKPKGQKTVIDVTPEGPAPTVEAGQVVMPGDTEGKVNQKQIAALMGRWSEYVKARVKGLTGAQIDEKLSRLIKSLYGAESKKDLTSENLSELLDYMEKGDINVTPPEEGK